MYEHGLHLRIVGDVCMYIYARMYLCICLLINFLLSFLKKGFAACIFGCMYVPVSGAACLCVCE